jgi:hypothetical protein
MISEGLEAWLDSGCGGGKRPLPNSNKQITCSSSSKEELSRSPVVYQGLRPPSLAFYGLDMRLRLEAQIRALTPDPALTSVGV